jgi:hypothetical protein
MTAELAPDDWYALYEQALDYAAKSEGPVGRSTLAYVTADQLDESRSDARNRIDRAVDTGVLTRYGTREQYLFDGASDGTSGYEHLLGDWDVDSDRVQHALASAAWWYHDQMETIHYEWVERQWGINEEVIDSLGIGYSTDGNGVIHHLREQGYSDVEIAAASIGTVTELKHIFRCDPSDCNHDMPDELDALSRALSTGDVDPEEVDVRGVIECAKDDDVHRIVDWWDERIVFPYGDEHGEISYLIARKTPQSDDVPGKYLKQQVREYTDTEAVYEPIYGVHCLPDDPEYVVLTEGMTDAIVAHQNGVPCLAPVTKQFKREHYDPLRELVRRTDRVYVVNDSEEDDVGLAGALRTANHLREHNVPAFVGELPRDGEAKVDMADFLREHSKRELEEEVLAGAVPPEQHDRYDEYVGEEDSGSDTSQDNAGEEYEGDVKSGLFDLTMDDILDKGYRGKNPIRHVGDSENYFVVHSEDSASDHKGGGDGSATYTYTGLTYAAAAGLNQREPPRAPLSDDEIWSAWLWAKKNRYLGSDDPCPSAGLRHVARTHTSLPKKRVEQYPDEFRFPREVYNRLLEIVEDEYGVDPGRDRLATTDRDEQAANLVMGDDDDDDEDDERVAALKKVLALSE